MTPEELEAIDAIEKLATPGTWRFSDWGCHVYKGSSDNIEGLICDIRGLGAGYDQGANGDFIAASRDFVPKAIAEIRRLRASVDQLILAYDLLKESREKPCE